MNLEAEVGEFLSALDSGTRKVYSRGLAAFLEFYKPQGSISDFLARVEEDSRMPRQLRRRVARNVLRMFADCLRQRGYSPKTVRSYVGTVQSLCRYYDLEVSTRYLKLPPDMPISRKKAWTAEEVGGFVDMMKKPIYKAIAAVAFQSGLGLGDVLSLKYRDIREEYEKGVTPIVLELRRKKTDTPFITFMGDWALTMLRQHLQGKALKDNDPLFNVTARAVQAYIRRLSRKFAGEFEGSNPCRVHSLRAAFNTILRDHKVDPNYVEFWMGHRLPEQQRTYMSKTREGWRQTYREQAETWLTPPVEKAPL